MTNNEGAEQAALVAVEKWLTQIDFANYEESWNLAAEIFKSQVTLEQWTESIKSVQESLGTIVSRALFSKQYATELPGAPDGEYVVFQYESTFENKQNAVETVTPMKDKDGEWRVSGYFVK
jgi:Protein of unknown function (DUF4019)